MEIEFDYSKITLEEIEMYIYHNFICDGDSKTIKVESEDK